MKSQTKMRCRQIRRILQYHVINKFFILSQSTYHLPLLFYAFTDEKQLLSGCLPGYQKKHPGTWFQDAVKIIKVTLNHTMIFSLYVIVKVIKLGRQSIPMTKMIKK